MNNASLELGGTNWAEKDGNILGYSVGDTSGKFSPQEFTFSRGSNLSATRINRAGLIVKGRENLLLQSNQFDTTWGNSNTTETGGQADKDGGTEAWLLTKTAGNGYLIQSRTATGVQTASIYAKAGDSDWIYLQAVGTSTASCYFDLVNGTTGNSASLIDKSIEAVGATGWYRCSITYNQTLANFRIYPAEANSLSATSGNIYIQSAQLEQGLAATPYIETTSTTAEAGVLENTPRLNYTTGVANPYLLLEPSRTNVITQSEYITNYFTIDADVTISANVAISPEGVQNAARLKYDLANRSMYKSSMGLTGDYSVSFWAKGDGSNIGKTFNLRLQGTSTDQNIAVTLTSDWVRVEAQTNGLNIFELTNRNSTTIDTGSILLFGFQIEAGTYPTSYIPTYGTSQTRAADNCYKTNASDVIGQTEGTLFLDISALSDDATNRRVTLSNETATNRMYVSYKNYTNQIRVEVISAGVSVFDSTYSSPNITQFSKIALAYKLNDFAFYVDGTQVSTDTSGAVPTSLTAFKFEDGSGGNSFFGNVNQALLYKERLTNAELATLTTL